MEKVKTLVDCRRQLLDRLDIAYMEIECVKHDLKDNLDYINATQKNLNQYKAVLHGFVLAYRISAKFDITEKQIEMVKDIIKGKKRALHYLFLNRKCLKLKLKEVQRKASKALCHLKGFDTRMKKKGFENEKK